MGDEDHGEPEILTQLLEQVDDLGLDGNIQGGDRFIGDDDLRLNRQGPGDADPLALPPGKLVGIPVEILLLEPHPTHELQHPPSELPRSNQTVNLQRLADDIPHPHPGIEGRLGVLKDHLHLPAEGEEFVFSQCIQPLSPKGDAPIRGGEQTHEQLGHRRLAAPRFPGQPQGLPFLQPEIDPVHGPQGPLLSQNPPPDRKQFGQPFALQQRGCHEQFTQRT